MGWNNIFLNVGSNRILANTITITICEIPHNMANCQLSSYCQLCKGCQSDFILHSPKQYLLELYKQLWYMDELEFEESWQKRYQIPCMFIQLPVKSTILCLNSTECHFRCFYSHLTDRVKIRNDECTGHSNLR